MNFDVINKAILDHSVECIVLISKDHKVLAYNKTIQLVLNEYFGKDLQIGDDYRDFVVDGAMQLYLDTFGKSVKGERHLVHHLTEGNGISIWFEYIMTPVYDDLHELIGVTLTAKNIDEEKKSRMELQELSDTLEAIIEDSKQFVTLLDPDFKIVMMNSIAKHTVAIHSRKVPKCGDDCRDYITAKKEDFVDVFQKALKGESSQRDVEYLDINGNTFWYQTRINPVYSKDATLLGVSVFASDISEKKRMEIRLRESEERFRTICAQAPICILISDERLNLTFSNNVAEEVFKISGFFREKISLSDFINDLRYINIDTITPMETDIIINEIFNDRQFIKGRNSQGDTLDLFAAASSIETGLSKHYLFILQDITENKKDKKVINQQLKRLKEIAWHQSHVLRAPVARILGLIYLLGEIEKTGLNEEVNFLIGQIKVTTEELDAVIRNIVDIAEPENQ